MFANQNCLTCRWRIMRTLPPAPPKMATETRHFCQRFPPVIAVNGEQLISAWPTVRPSDGCGEWTAYAAPASAADNINQTMAEQPSVVLSFNKET